MNRQPLHGARWGLVVLVSLGCEGCFDEAPELEESDACIDFAVDEDSAFLTTDDGIVDLEGGALRIPPWGDFEIQWNMYYRIVGKDASFTKTFGDVIERIQLTPPTTPGVYVELERDAPKPAKGLPGSLSELSWSTDLLAESPDLPRSNTYRVDVQVRQGDDDDVQCAPNPPLDPEHGFGVGDFLLEPTCECGDDYQYDLQVLGGSTVPAGPFAVGEFFDFTWVNSYAWTPCDNLDPDAQGPDSGEFLEAIVIYRIENGAEEPMSVPVNPRVVPSMKGGEDEVRNWPRAEIASLIPSGEYVARVTVDTLHQVDECLPPGAPVDLQTALTVNTVDIPFVVE